MTKDESAATGDRPDSRLSRRSVLRLGGTAGGLAAGGLLQLADARPAQADPIDLFGGPLNFQVGMNSLFAPTGRWGVALVGPGTPGWPAGLTSDRIFHYDTIAWLHASGTVNSGVLFTGPTPPIGWQEMKADSDAWLMQNVPRYGLIGALTTRDFPDPDEWFSIGTDWGTPSTPVTWSGPMSPPPVTSPPTRLWAGPPTEWRRLFLACNRPQPGPTGGGDGFWDISLRVQTLTAADVPDCSITPTSRNFICMSQLDAAVAASRSAERACQAAAAAKRDADAAWTTVQICATGWAIVGVGLSIATTGNFFAEASQEVQNALAEVTAHYAALISAAGAGAGVAGGVGVSIAAGLEPLVAIVVTALTTATGVLTAWAIAKAVTMGWIAVIIIGVVCALLISLLVIAIVAIGTYMAKVREVDRQQLAFRQQRDQWDQSIAGADSFCCPAVVTADPDPALHTRPTCGS